MRIMQRRKKMIYVIFICLMIAVFFIFFFKNRMEIQTMRSGEALTVRILKVACDGSKESRNYFVFREGNSNHIVNVSSEYCNNYRVGDSVTVLHNKNHDLYFSKEINTSDNKWGMIFPVFFIIITMLFLFFPKLFKKLG